MERKMNASINQKEDKKKTKFMIELIILIILMLLVFITSFRSGQKFFVLTNTNFGTTKSYLDTGVAKWYFDAKIMEHY